jgi:hypothetical protein
MHGKSVRVILKPTRNFIFRAKSYRVLFAVRPDEKRTAKTLPCIFLPLPCARGARQTACFP